MRIRIRGGRRELVNPSLAVFLSSRRRFSPVCRVVIVYELRSPSTVHVLKLESGIAQICLVYLPVIKRDILIPQPTWSYMLDSGRIFRANNIS